jgi:hypothetical protein
MKQLISVLALVVLGVAIAAPDGPLNQLTPQEKSQGWKLLFDGKTLDGWVMNGGATWTVVNGAMVPGGSGGGWPGTKEDYSNFQLRLEFRTNVPNINSGIYLRRGRIAGDSHTMGYELQIRNPGPKDRPYDGKPDNHNGYYFGSFSGHLKSNNEPAVVMGQWHSVDVTANGDHFIVLIDGKKVLDARHAEFKSGAIGIQGGRSANIEFRNIKIKTL